MIPIILEDLICGTKTGVEVNSGVTSLGRKKTGTGPQGGKKEGGLSWFLGGEKQTGRSQP